MASEHKADEAEDGQPLAYKLALKQREIGIAEFFSRNRHLLGFDNKRKALLTVVKECVDNSLDACEEARILPDVTVETIEMSPERYRVIVEDNGPGIVKSKIPNIFAKLLYGSKFHSLKQARGQQGMGVSASVLYGQLTTGRPAKIISRISKGYPAESVELHIDTKKNKPEVVSAGTAEWDKEHGTRVEIDIEATYLRGMQSPDEYLKETAIINPHANITYTNPKAEQVIYSRVSDKLPVEPKEIKPHPYGVELGILCSMLADSPARTLQAFLTSEFCRVGASAAKEICERAALLPSTKPASISRQQAEKITEAIKNTRLIAPPTDCISPLGAGMIEKGLRKEVNAEFYCSISRSPSVYRGYPFVIEAGLAYGGALPADRTATLLRFANRVPLLYQQGACAVTESVTHTNWKAYGLQQSNRSLPVGHLVILVHIASVWVPFTSEAKEAIAHYPKIIKEVKLALQDCGRKLSMYVRKKRRIRDELKKRGFIGTYIPHIGLALKQIIGLSDSQEERVNEELKAMLEQKRGVLEDIEFRPDKNVDFEEDLALPMEGSEGEEAEARETKDRERDGEDG